MIKLALIRELLRFDKPKSLAVVSNNSILSKDIVQNVTDIIEQIEPSLIKASNRSELKLTDYSSLIATTPGGLKGRSIDVLVILNEGKMSADQRKELDDFMPVIQSTSGLVLSVDHI